MYLWNHYCLLPTMLSHYRGETFWLCYISQPSRMTAAQKACRRHKMWTKSEAGLRSDRTVRSREEKRECQAVLVLEFVGKISHQYEIRKSVLLLHNSQRLLFSRKCHPEAGLNLLCIIIFCLFTSFIFILLFPVILPIRNMFISGHFLFLFQMTTHCMVQFSFKNQAM